MAAAEENVRPLAATTLSVAQRPSSRNKRKFLRRCFFFPIFFLFFFFFFPPRISYASGRHRAKSFAVIARATATHRTPATLARTLEPPASIRYRSLKMPSNFHVFSTAQPDTDGSHLRVSPSRLSRRFRGNFSTSRKTVERSRAKRFSRRLYVDAFSVS